MKTIEEIKGAIHRLAPEELAELTVNQLGLGSHVGPIIGSLVYLVPTYYVLAVLYAPWLVTLVAGVGSLLVHRFCRPT